MPDAGGSGRDDLEPLLPAPSVLLVTGLAVERDFYGDALRRAGCRVSLSPDPQHAMRVIADLRPAVVITRMRQPGCTVTGFDLSRFIRIQAPLGRAAVLALSPAWGDDDIRLAVAAGCDRLVQLPCTPDEMLAQVLFLCGLRPTPRPAEAGGALRQTRATRGRDHDAAIRALVSRSVPA